jgi:hypothetical protein
MNQIILFIAGLSGSFLPIFLFMQKKKGQPYRTVLVCIINRFTTSTSNQLHLPTTQSTTLPTTHSTPKPTSIQLHLTTYTMSFAAILIILTRSLMHCLLMLIKKNPPPFTGKGFNNKTQI